MRLLLLSNSTNYQEPYLKWCAERIASFVAEQKDSIVFVPYAAVGFSYDDYTQKVNDALAAYNVSVKGIHTFDNPKEAVVNASAIFVGGGNTFALLKNMYDHDLVGEIQQAVDKGASYVGWSAGSNVASPSICTTNDMPIVEPASFKALGFITKQINPHFTNKVIPNHGGESREMRLQEYISANPDQSVLCLPEGSFLIKDGVSLVFDGSNPGHILSNAGTSTLCAGSIVS